MQPLRAGTIHGEPAHQNDARLRARSQDHRYTRQPRLKSLAQESRQQPPDEPMFKVNLHHVARIAAIV
jgi:hypothetical protein